MVQLKVAVFSRNRFTVDLNAEAQKIGADKAEFVSRRITKQPQKNRFLASKRAFGDLRGKITTFTIQYIYNDVLVGISQVFTSERFSPKVSYNFRNDSHKIRGFRQFVEFDRISFVETTEERFVSSDPMHEKWGFINRNDQLYHVPL